MLVISLTKHRNAYRSGGKTTDDKQRRRAKLIKVIEDKIESKRLKIKDIKHHLVMK